ncbi:hypothetical protein LZ198_21630 [Myxococcus sp. K15C18031901]|uniref:hypothetical protein n=1 Tax=Myxococcus dinghuensis TaxID=2906761 RepID=UPI0020A83247|nr:hypothetical protein [Myxococcus dinghuensis]MCP3101480.1 hypothetical protein [Myxococcus dinghuensis]
MWFLFGVTIVVLCLILPFWILGHSSDFQWHLEKFLASGLPVTPGRIESMSALVRGGRVNHVAYYGTEVVFVFDRPEGPVRVVTSVSLPESLLHLFIAGSRCSARLAREDPRRLVVVSIDNAHGVATPVQLVSGPLYTALREVKG